MTGQNPALVIGRTPSPGHGSGDLDSVEAIERLVRRFYGDVAQDDLLSPMFKLAGVEWASHIDKLTAFWSRLLLGIPGFNGNALQAHRRVNAQRPFTPAHFERWLNLFTGAVDSEWSGPNAERAKTLAHRMAAMHEEQIVGTPTTAS